MMGLVARRIVGLQEVETYWTLADCAMAWQALLSVEEHKCRAVEAALGE